MRVEPHTLAGADASREPLGGLGIVITRPARQAAAFAQKIAALGASPIVFPAIVVLPPVDRAPLEDIHARLREYDFAVFVSANAVEYGAPPAPRWPAPLVAFAPGPGTAEALAAAGIPDVRFAPTLDSEADSRCRSADVGVGASSSPRRRRPRAARGPLRERGRASISWRAIRNRPVQRCRRACRACARARAFVYRHVERGVDNLWSGSATKVAV